MLSEDRRPEALQDAPAAEPPCPHFGRCGGCALQDIADEAVASWKRDRVVGALAARGIETEIGETITIPAHTRRRLKLTLQRTKKSAHLGFLEARSHQIVPIEACPIARPEIVTALPMLKKVGLAGAPRRRAVTLTVTASETGLDVAVEHGKELDLDTRQILAEAADGADLARLVWNGEQIAERRPPVIRFGGHAVVPPPGAFLQAASEAEDIMRAAALTACEGTTRVADLFAGCGAFALPMAALAETDAFEGDVAMAQALDRGWRRADGLRRVRAKARDLFRRPLLTDELNIYDVVVFDPPRAGAEAQSRQLAASRVPRAVGISCDPATFARDASLLIAGGFRLIRVDVIDQFRWSPHIEVVGQFTRGGTEV